MRVALVNPPWRFEGSIYFGCREPHLPFELGYADALLRQAGHETLLLDCHLCDRSTEAACKDIETFGAEMTVVTTAPTYLFWRCAPPELRVPAQFSPDARATRRADCGGWAAWLGQPRTVH
jgi:anaerobic magnesium-protoporphyrin IX monomethyl ester cyclase